MPSRPFKPCSYPGCPELVQQGSRCEKHKRQVTNDYDRKRGSASKRGYDRKWQVARKQYLAEHPLCVECLKQNRYIPATVVDHIIPHKGDARLFWDRKNWQGLCDHHHNVKTAREDGGFGNARR